MQKWAIFIFLVFGYRNGGDILYVIQGLGNRRGRLFGKLDEKFFRFGRQGSGERGEVELFLCQFPAGSVKDRGEPGPAFHFLRSHLDLISGKAAQGQVAQDVLEDRHVRVQGVPGRDKGGVLGAESEHYFLFELFLMKLTMSALSLARSESTVYIMCPP